MDSIKRLRCYFTNMCPTFNLHNLSLIDLKSKAVPLHATEEELGGEEV
jgi:hypothetical protein